MRYIDQYCVVLCHEKKVLALVLAFACAFTMFAGAAFTDAADINADNADAVELLTALGVINGYEDGSYRPDVTVTRAEMAKMIFTIRNGGNDDASAYETVSTSFTDISGHWAEGYIKYLQNTGIVAGKSATEFDPDGTVTTGEAMKMALVLAGYRADKAGLTGTQWLNNTVSYATTYGLTKDVNSSIASGCTRQDAAQILSNALDMDAVLWSEFVGDFLYDGTEGMGSGVKQSVGLKWMDLATETGLITEVPSSKTNPKGITFVDEDGVPHNFKNVTTDVSGLLGYEVKVVWNSGDVNAADAIYGIYKTDNNTSYDVYMSDVEQDGAKVKFGGSSYKVATGGMDVYVDGEKVATDATSAYFAAEPQVPDQITLIDNDGDGSLDAIVRTPAAVVKVKYVGPSSITTGDTMGSAVQDLVNSPDLADITIYDGMAKDDYALATYDIYTDKVTYTKLDVQNATIEGVKGAEIMIGDSWYKAADDYTLPSSLIAGDTIEYVVVNDLLYYVKKTDGSFGSNSLAMIYYMADGASVDANKVLAKIITKDGTKKTVNVAKEGGKLALYDAAGTQTTATGAAVGTIGNGATWIGKMVTYKVNGDDEYTFKVVSDTNNAGYDDQEKMTAATGTGYNNKKLSGLTYELADDAVIFYLIGTAGANAAGNDAKVYSGKDLINAFGDGASANTTGKKITTIANDWALISKISGFKYTTAAAVSGSEKLSAITGATYGYLTADAYNRTEGGDDYDYFKVWTTAGTITAKMKGNDYASYKAGMAISFDVESEADGVATIKNVALAPVTTGAVTIYDGDKKLEISGVGTVTLDDDSVVLYVDSADKTGVESGSIMEADGTIANVRVLKDNDDNIDLLIVDVDNKITTDPATFTAADFAAAQTILNRGANVVVASVTTGSTALSIPEGQTVTVTGELDQDSNDITGKGTLIVGTIADATAAALIKCDNVTVTGSVAAATLEAIPVVAGKTLVLKQDSSDAAATASTWFTSVGKAETSSGANDGEAGASIASSSEIPADTYVGSSVYTGTTGAATTKWLAK